MYFDLAPVDINPERPRYNAQNLRDFVNNRSSYFGFTGDEIRGPRRDREFVQIRETIAVELRGRGYSLSSIGRALGGRDHSTIWALLKGGKRKCSSAK